MKGIGVGIAIGGEDTGHSVEEFFLLLWGVLGLTEDPSLRVSSDGVAQRVDAQGVRAM